MDSADFLPAGEIERALEDRLGRFHARQRRGIEIDHEAQKFGQGLTFFHIENLPILDAVIGAIVRLSGAWPRGRANAARVRLRHNELLSDRLPARFDEFRILHLTDLHADMSEPAMVEAARLVSDLQYDLCVLTGDYRGRTFGPYHRSLTNMLRLRESLRGDIYGVLGNHDTVLMLPDLERMGIRMLMNEHLTIERGGSTIFLAGIDDAHFYRVDNIEKVAAAMPARHVLDPAVAHPRDLSPGVACRLRLHAGRAYAWRPDLLAWRHSGHTLVENAAIVWQRRMAVSGDGRLHIRWRRRVWRSGAVQLPA